MQFKSNIQISKNEYLNTYNIFKKGYIAFEGHKSKEFRFGRFVENDIGDGIVSHIFIVFRPIMEFDINFWKYAINNELIMQSILSRATKASTMMNDLVVKDFLKEIFFVPSVGEQACIGKTLKTIDHLITLHQSKSFGHIFEVIVSCTLSWEQRKLINCLSLLKDGTHGTDKDYPSGPLLLSAKNIKNGRVYYDETDRRISYKDFEKIHRNFKLQIGDILLTIVGSIGETALLKDSFEITFQRSVAFLRAKDNILPEFLISEFNTGRFRNELEDRKSTSAQPGIYLGDLGEIPVFVSKNPAEQRRVGSYFESLDHLITLHQLEPFQMIFKAIAYRIIDYAKSKPPRCRKHTGLISFIKNTIYKNCVYTQYIYVYSLKTYYIKDIILLRKSAYICNIII